MRGSAAGELSRKWASLGAASFQKPLPRPPPPSPDLGVNTKGLATFSDSCVSDARHGPSEVLQEYLHCREKREEWFYVSSWVSADPPTFTA